MQIFNNQSMKKSDEQLSVRLNFIFSIICTADLLLQLLTNQIWKQENDYRLLSLERVDLARSKTGEADNSDEIEDEMEESDDSTTKAYKEKLHEKIQIGEKEFTIGEIQYFKKRFRQDEILYIKQSEGIFSEFCGNCCFSGVTMILLYVLAIFAVFHTPETCGFNQALTEDGFCFDCIKTLGNETCALCEEFNVCKQCRDGFFLGDVQVADITVKGCVTCQKKFGMECINCN